MFKGTLKVSFEIGNLLSELLPVSLGRLPVSLGLLGTLLPSLVSLHS